ncbi:PTS sugar transporter subunit IIA [Pectinatus haikarae]|uniref:PTS system mannose-specific IIA component n=1 Tax=Pectinatus haikarae TaxID=349096 RepID=A0ABT9YB74_9FIRM|nr:PTS sugar transporter subunit IIA [Pectinatus haikarae]MDQ0205101.1 PTS system mannose-specific IIA component [Pectinatus haikarae]
MKIVVISHGDFAKGIINSVQMLAGRQKNLKAYGLYPEEDREVLEKKIEQELITSREANEEVLILSDIFHGSPFNAAIKLMKNYDFYHVTGINIPLLVLAILERSRGTGAADICDKMLVEFFNTVQDARRLLTEESDDTEDEIL